MYLRCLAFLAFTALALARTTTTQDVLNGVSELEVEASSLQEDLQGILAQANPGLTDALNLHGSINSLMDRAEEAISVIKMISPSPVSVEECTAVLRAFEKVQPGIESGLKLLIDKKPTVDGIQGGRVSAIVALSLIQLKKCVTDIQDALFDAAPMGCLDKARALGAQFESPASPCFTGFPETAVLQKRSIVLPTSLPVLSMAQQRPCKELEPVQPQTPPALLGSVFDLMLLGVLTVQLYIYYVSFPNDRKLVKFAVFWVYLVGIAQTILVLWDLYNFAVFVGCVHRTVAAHFWFSGILSSAIVALTVQWFYAYRIYVLSKKYWIRVVIVGCSLAQLISSILGSICRVGEMNDESGRDIIAVTRKSFCWTGFNPIWGPINVACDLTITVFMSYFLMGQCGGTIRKSLHTRLTRMIQIIIQTGMATSTVVLVYTVFLNSVEPKLEVWCLLPALVMGAKQTANNNNLALCSHLPSCKGFHISARLVIVPYSQLFLSYDNSAHSASNISKLADIQPTPSLTHTNSETLERKAHKRRNSTSSSTESSWDHVSDEPLRSTTSLHTPQAYVNVDAGVGADTRRQVIGLGARESVFPAGPSASPTSAPPPRTFLTPVDQVRRNFSRDDEASSGRRVPKKSQSSPVLSAPSFTPMPAGTVSPLHIPSTQDLPSSPSGHSPEPPPYTSLPPPLMVVPVVRSGPNGMSVSGSVPIPVSMAGAAAIVGDSTRHNLEMEDEEDEGTDNGDDGVVYTSWNGLRPSDPSTSPSASSFSGSRGNGSSSVLPPTASSSEPRPSFLNNVPTPQVPYPRLGRSKSGSNMGLRRRIFAIVGGTSSNRSGERECVSSGETECEGESEWENGGRPICTTPGMVCAGETETETDEPSRHLPTARVPRTSSRLSTSFSFSQANSFTALPWPWLLFEFSRLLAVVPASLGFIWCLWNIYAYQPKVDRCAGLGRPPPDRIDYIVASLWALLTAHQCLSLTTGLLTRWRHYYAPLSTLVRLLALQGICWPATHLTVNIFEAAKRPAVVWALIGTTTCMSRSIQIWVVSNLPTNSASSQGISNGAAADTREREKEREKRRAMEAEGGKPSSSYRGYGYVYWKKWNKWRRKRRWDWREVSIKCVLPAGILYLVTAWAGEMRRELGGC
ncbi:hypothetical protein D9756_010502 [Leucocoprinus leucothites]|uniref:DUF6534 domain-containing protein n=1 Tax=Leucocoprinus leucothites TaxID=201217 RepID=A0A8H5CVB3_9AGAR|nr:hypothetical protein D9756_010502 [Leucoagaricus leucothites]